MRQISYSKVEGHLQNICICLRYLLPIQQYVCMQRVDSDINLLHLGLHFYNGAKIKSSHDWKSHLCTVVHENYFILPDTKYIVWPRGSRPFIIRKNPEYIQGMLTRNVLAN